MAALVAAQGLDSDSEPETAKKSRLVDVYKLFFVSRVGKAVPMRSL